MKHLLLVILLLAACNCGVEEFPPGYVCRHDDLPAKLCSIGDELGVIYQGTCYIDPNPACRPRIIDGGIQ